jgi:hypothetical protein
VYEQPLLYLEHCAAKNKDCGSLMFVYLKQIYTQRDWTHVLNVLNRESRWLVVMDVVVTHAPRSVAAPFFGLLYDAPVQVLDSADADRVAAMYELAEQCERGCDPRQAQRIVRRTAAELDQELQDFFTDKKKYREGNLTTRLRPAIMFRWCPYMCNHACRRFPSAWTFWP